MTKAIPFQRLAMPEVLHRSVFVFHYDLFIFVSSIFVLLLLQNADVILTDLSSAIKQIFPTVPLRYIIRKVSHLSV